jgi:hypothetical protein
MSCSFLPGRWSAPRQSDCYGSLERASEQWGTLYARSFHTGNRTSKRMLNGQAQQEAWPSITMLLLCGVLPTHPCFRRLVDTHDVSRPRWARPGLVHPWHRLEEQWRADRGFAAASSPLAADLHRMVAQREAECVIMYQPIALSFPWLHSSCASSQAGFVWQRCHVPSARDKLPTAWYH